MNWGQKVTTLREKAGLNQTELAEKARFSGPYISKIESDGVKSPTTDIINRFAPIFKKSPGELAAYLYGSEVPSATINFDDLLDELKKQHDLTDLSEAVKLPISGYINAGIPAIAEAVDLGFTYVERKELAGVLNVEKVIVLKISGESLIGDGIANGSTVIVDPNQQEIIDGKVYAVKLDNEICARHVHRENDSVILTSSNGKYSKITVNKLELIGRIILKGKPDWEKV